MSEHSNESADAIVAEVESGARNPVGWQLKLFLGIAFTWSIYQLFIATALPYYLAEITGQDFFLGTLNHARRVAERFQKKFSSRA